MAKQQWQCHEKGEVYANPEYNTGWVWMYDEEEDHCYWMPIHVEFDSSGQLKTGRLLSGFMFRDLQTAIEYTEGKPDIYKNR